MKLTGLIIKLIVIMVIILFIAAAPVQCFLTETVTENDEEVDKEGFLLTGEYIYENPAEGVWRYNSSSLRIEIKRFYNVAANLTWTEAEIFSKDHETFRMVPNDKTKWMKSQDKPTTIALKNQVVFAVNSDFAHMRMSRKMTPGIIIRDGKIITNKTKKANASGFPNLDTLVLFPDGDMRVFLSNEHTAAEYLEMGAVDVLAFGPYLIRDGQLNEVGIKKYGNSKAPRTAIGMVEKGHYLAMMLEGRHDKSKGAGVSFLAMKLFEKGCVTAMNLDGGQTATMLFMGKQIIRVGKSASDTALARQTAELLGIGTSRSIEFK